MFVTFDFKSIRYRQINYIDIKTQPADLRIGLQIPSPHTATCDPIISVAFNIMSH